LALAFVIHFVKQNTKYNEKQKINRLYYRCGLQRANRKIWNKGHLNFLVVLHTLFTYQNYHPANLSTIYLLPEKHFIFHQ